MDIRGGRRSSNIEDRRGMRPVRTGVGISLGGILFLGVRLLVCSPPCRTMSCPPGRVNVSAGVSAVRERTPWASAISREDHKKSR